MDALFEIIRNQMLKHVVQNYHLEQVLLKADPTEKVTLNVNNDYYFFANAFTDAGILNGRISGIGGGNALDINPLTSNMKLYKYQMFKGNLVLENFDPVNILYVELLRITPIPAMKN